MRIRKNKWFNKLIPNFNHADQRTVKKMSREARLEEGIQAVVDKLGDLN